MLWVIPRDYKANTTEIRAANLQSHRNYTQSHKDILVLAGALQDDAGTVDTGTLLAIHVNSREEAQTSHDGDPYTKAGVFGRLSITRMRKGPFNPLAAERA